jgi:hypothetical protein
MTTQEDPIGSQNRINIATLNSDSDDGMDDQPNKDQPDKKEDTIITSDNHIWTVESEEGIKEGRTRFILRCTTCGSTGPHKESCMEVTIIEKI